jgi:hypothetical protein
LRSDGVFQQKTGRQELTERRSQGDQKIWHPQEHQRFELGSELHNEPAFFVFRTAMNTIFLFLELQWTRPFYKCVMAIQYN